MSIRESQAFFALGSHSVSLNYVETQARDFFSKDPGVVNIYFAENYPWPESAYKTTKRFQSQHSSYFSAVIQANRLREHSQVFSRRDLEREKARLAAHVESSQAAGEGNSVYSVAELFMIDRLEKEIGLIVETEYIPDSGFKEAMRLDQEIGDIENTMLNQAIQGRLDQAIATTQNGFKGMAVWINNRNEMITDELYQAVRNTGGRTFRLYTRLGADHDTVEDSFRQRFIPEDVPTILHEFDSDGSDNRSYVERVLLKLQKESDGTVSVDEACRIILEKLIQIQLLSAGRTREQVISTVDKVLERTDYEEIDSLL